MSDPRVVRFYLPKPFKRHAESGEHNFINKFNAVLKAEGFKIKFHNDGFAEQIKSETRPGYSVFLMTEPTTKRGLTIRLNYFYPFWNIEQTGKRWDWPVSKAQFEAAKVRPDVARRFTGHLRQKNFKTAVNTTSQDGFVYVPLQGRLLTRRSFQYCSPIEMIKHLLTHDVSRNIVATLHPAERYSDQEKTALFELEEKHPRLTVGTQDMQVLLQKCDYVATQNSAVALSGFFFHKPAVLFGRVNFHHIAANVHDLGPKESIARAPTLKPDYDAYLWWFFQEMSINAGHADAESKILHAIKRAGWVA